MLFWPREVTGPRVLDRCRMTEIQLLAFDAVFRPHLQDSRLLVEHDRHRGAAVGERRQRRNCPVNVALGLCSFMAIVLTGCDTGKVAQVERGKLTSENPTSYVFDVPIDSVCRAIDSGIFFDSNLQVIWKADSSPFAEPPFTSLDFNSIAGDHDAFLWSEHEVIGKSPVYRDEDGRALDFLANFFIQITPVDDGRTRVEVFAVDTQVIAGTTSGLLDPHGTANIYRDVTPTTIEEYEILLAIGRLLGRSRGMPEIVTK